MKKSKIFIAAGATLLGIVGFFSTKANKSFNGVTTGTIFGTSVSLVGFGTYTDTDTNQTVLLVTNGNGTILFTMQKPGGGDVYHF